MLKSLKEISIREGLLIANDNRTLISKAKTSKKLSEYGWFNHFYIKRCLKYRTGALLTRKHIVDQCPNLRKNTIKKLRESGKRLSNRTSLENFDKHFP